MYKHDIPHTMPDGWPILYPNTSADHTTNRLCRHRGHTAFIDVDCDMSIPEHTEYAKNRKKKIDFPPIYIQIVNVYNLFILIMRMCATHLSIRS